MIYNPETQMNSILLSWQILLHYPKAKTARYSFKELCKMAYSQTLKSPYSYLMHLAGVQGFIDIVL